MNISATVSILILTVFLSLSAPAYAVDVPSYPHTVVGCAKYTDGTPALDGELVTLYKLGYPLNNTTAVVGVGFDDKPGWWKANLNAILGGVSDGDIIVITVLGKSTTLVVDTSTGGQQVSDTSHLMSVAADPTRVTGNTATAVSFTVTSGGSPVVGALVTLMGCGVSTSVTTDTDGIAAISVTATEAGDIVVNVTKDGYADSPATLTVIGLTTSPMSVAADPTSVTENTATNVTFNVTSDGSPVEGALVTLYGCGVDVNESTGPDGIAIISVNASDAGTIDVTVTNDGYTDATTGVDVNAPVSSVDTGKTTTGGGSGDGTYPPGWRVTPTPTPTATLTPTAASEPTVATTDATTVATTEAPTKASKVAPTEIETTELTTTGTPGFGAVSTVFAIAGLLVVTYLVMRRRE